MRMGEWMNWRVACVVLFFSVLLLVAMPVEAQDDGLTISVSKQMGYNMGSQIQGTFKIRVREPENLASVVFRIDGEVIGEAVTAPFELRFETGDYSPGWHEVDAVGTTGDGKSLQSKVLSFQFVSNEAAMKGAMQLLVPVLVLVFGALAVSAIMPLLSGRKLQPYDPEVYTPDAPRNYGMVGGAVCPKCGRPFGIHWWGLNISFVGKFDRCPHCGKWSLVRRATRDDLMAAEAAEYTEHTPSKLQPQTTEEEKLREHVEDSRYTEL